MSSIFGCFQTQQRRQTVALSGFTGLMKGQVQVLRCHVGPSQLKCGKVQELRFLNQKFCGCQILVSLQFQAYKFVVCEKDDAKGQAAEVRTTVRPHNHERKLSTHVVNLLLSPIITITTCHISVKFQHSPSLDLVSVCCKHSGWHLVFSDVSRTKVKPGYCKHDSILQSSRAKPRSPINLVSSTFCRTHAA